MDTRPLKSGRRLSTHLVRLLSPAQPTSWLITLCRLNSPIHAVSLVAFASLHRPRAGRESFTPFRSRAGADTSRQTPRTFDTEVSLVVEKRCRCVILSLSPSRLSRAHVPMGRQELDASPSLETSLASELHFSHAVWPTAWPTTPERAPAVSWLARHASELES